jgi:hypothetical protein
MKALKRKGENPMDEKFDQLAKGVAESVTRRQAFGRFTFGMVGMVLAAFVPSSRAAQSCIPSGEFCEKGGSGPAHAGCNNCCSKSFFCMHSEDVAQTCFCN